MRIAVDISPIDTSSTSAHKVRGVGQYIQLLVDNLEKFDDRNSYIFTSKPQKSVDVDLIHYPYFDPFFITLPFKKQKKTLVTVHDVIPLVHKKEFPVGVRGRVKWQLNKKLLKGVDGVLTDSDASKEDIVTVTGIVSRKIFPIYLSVDEEFKKISLTDNQKEEFLKKYNLPNKFILYVGDVTWNKNLPRLVAAAKKTNTTLVMVGKALLETNFERKNPWNRDRIQVEQMTRDDPRFIKLGFIPTIDLVRLYNLADVLCMPSLAEGFGLPVLEAMKCGCPTLISKMGSLPEVGGTAAHYVDAISAEDIGRGIERITTNPQLKEELGKKGIENSKRFTLEKMIKDTVAVYEKF